MARMSCLREEQNGQGCVHVRALYGVCVRTCVAAGLTLTCGGSSSCVCVCMYAL